MANLSIHRLDWRPLVTLLLGACLPASGQAAQPTNLTAVLQRIAAQSPAIQAAQASERAAGAQERRARAAWFGNVDAYARSVHYNDPRLTRPITQPPNVAQYPFASDQLGYGIEVQLPLDVSGQIRANVRAAIADSRKANWSAEEQRLETIQKGAALYRKLQAVAVQDSALQAQQQALADSLAVARTGLKVGSIARVNLLRVEAAEAEVQGQLAGVEGQERQLRAQLAALMGSPRFDEAIEPLDGTPARLPAPHIAAVVPRLAAAQNAAAAAAAREAAANRAQWPQLALTGNWNHNAVQFDEQPAETWEVVLGLKLNLWSGGGQHAAVATARATREAAEDRARQAQLDLNAAREGAAAGWRAQSKAYLSATAGLAAAKESAHIERDRFRVGLGSATDLIDAEAALAKARASVAGSLAAWWEADDTLRYSYGEPPLAFTDGDEPAAAAQGN